MSMRQKLSRLFSDLATDFGLTEPPTPEPFTITDAQADQFRRLLWDVHATCMAVAEWIEDVDPVPALINAETFITDLNAYRNK